MAEEKQDSKKPQVKKEEKKHTAPIIEDSLVRILATDVPGSKKVIVGLTEIKGVSWGFSNAVCTLLKIDKKRAVSSLSKEEIENISDFIKNPAKHPGMPSFLLNRRKDFETGENMHLYGSDLDLQKEFDVKRLKKIRSYRGLRHATGQPSRGQRTKSHFRTRGKKKAVGVRSKPGGKK